jgi:hypothetical protein
MKDKLTFYVTLMVSFTLCVILLSMVAAMMFGLFVSNDIIDNDDIFPLIGPAFQTIVGGFIGLLAGIKMNETEERKQSEGEL